MFRRRIEDCAFCEEEVCSNFQLIEEIRNNGELIEGKETHGKCSFRSFQVYLDWDKIKILPNFCENCPYYTESEKEGLPKAVSYEEEQWKY